jgi:GR25 family glycosyltransferase involved in LPS biosynthesis
MVDKIYIIHYEPLIERKQYLDSVLPLLNIDYEYVLMNSKTDAEVLANLDDIYFYDEALWKKMNLNEIGVSVFHLNVYKKILQENHKLCLILEDDAVLTNDFLDSLNKLKSEIVDFDLVFLSTCCNLTSTPPLNKKISPSTTTRCTAGYLIYSECISKILASSKKFFLPIDWHLNYLQPICNLTFGWCEPPIITQGSETVYKSNLR